MRVRTTVKLEEDIVLVARMFAVKEGGTLSDVIEDALKSYIPQSIGIEMKDGKAIFPADRNKGPLERILKKHKPMQVPIKE